MDHNPIDTYRRKLTDARTALASTFIVLVTGPTEDGHVAHLICGSGQDVDPTEFNNFDAYTIGQSEADVREVEESLVFWDAEERSEHSEDGDDYHAIVAGKAMADCLRESTRDAANPTALAVEAVLVDAPDRLYAIHFDGELERITVAPELDIRFLAGSTDPAKRTEVLDAVKAAVVRHGLTEAGADAAVTALASTAKVVKRFVLDGVAPLKSDE